MSWTPFLIAVVLVIAPTCQTHGSVVVGQVPYSRDDPFLWAHLIVRGEVAAVDSAWVTPSEWGVVSTNSSDPVEVDIIRVRVAELLKGATADHVVEFTCLKSLHSPYPCPVTVGDEVILAAYLNRTSMKWELSTYSGLLIRNGKRWEHPAPRELQYVVDSPSKTMEEVKSRIDAVTPGRLAEESDLIVTATLVEINRRDSRECWGFSVASVLKGETHGGEIEFCFPMMGSVAGSDVRVPEGAVPGDTWVLLLKNDGGGPALFAGSNGMFKLDGDKVFYDFSVPMGISKRQLFEVCRVTSSDE